MNTQLGQIVKIGSISNNVVTLNEVPPMFIGGVMDAPSTD
jgi:hypothetical protein